MKVQLEPGAYEPKREHPTDAGLDIRAMYNQVVPARGYAVFHTGVHVEIPKGMAGFIKSKSGLNVHHDIITTGVIDEGFTGCVIVKLYNLGHTNYSVLSGDKIAQLVLVPVAYEDIEVVPYIKGGARGSAGFGSTGR